MKFIVSVNVNQYRYIQLTIALRIRAFIACRVDQNMLLFVNWQLRKCTHAKIQPFPTQYKSALRSLRQKIYSHKASSSLIS